VLFPQNNNLRSQDLPEVYFDAGMFYIATRETWLDESKFWFNGNFTFVEIERDFAIDVDTPEDLAELIAKFNAFSKKQP